MKSLFELLYEEFAVGDKLRRKETGGIITILVVDRRITIQYADGHRSTWSREVIKMNYEHI